MNSQALNFTEPLPCVFPAELLSGQWMVTEFEEGDSVIYSATITPTDETHIQIISDAVNPPIWHLTDIVLSVDWDEMTLYRVGNSVSGTITDVDEFRLNYKYGTPDELFKVNRKYKR